MSVRTGQRGHHIREIYEAATPAVSYTLDRCVQEKNFPKSQRWLLASPIATEATAYFSSLAKARADEDYAPERVREHALDEAPNETLIVSDWQVELGSVATDFEPYKGSSTSLDWTNSVGTLYGGYVDLIEGKLVQTHKSITLDGSEGWFDYKTSQQMHFVLSIPDKKSGLGTSISSIFPNVKNISFWDNELYSQYGDHGTLKNIYVNAPYKMPDLVSEWKAWLAEHPMQLVYELATPIEYDIDPQTLKTFRGANNIWSNANSNIEIKYWTH